MSTVWAATISPTVAATSTTPSSRRFATTSAASSSGSGFYCVSSWQSSSLPQIQCQREMEILHRRLAYRRVLLDKAPRAKAVLELAAEKAGWGQPLPERVGRGVSVQFAFATYMAQVAEVEVSKDGAVRVRRVVCAVACGTAVNPQPRQ